MLVRLVRAVRSAFHRNIVKGLVHIWFLSVHISSRSGRLHLPYILHRDLPSASERKDYPVSSSHRLMESRYSPSLSGSNPALFAGASCKVEGTQVQGVEESFVPTQWIKRD